MRSAVLGSGLALTLALAALTIRDLIRYGFTPLDFLAFVVLGLFAVVLVGLLRGPRE